ncbi:Peptidase, C1A family [Desulfonema magnum]|uniref:Peptidase, C1A family n=1 Tax=Desulfonema magnum TaxID=45655 RepID=A0A975BIF4_9BACT|nr:Peptidase, C1A family [Desulfonema magnum]
MRIFSLLILCFPHSIGASDGDVNGSGNTDLSDVVTALQICAGMNLDASPESGEKIGLKDAIFALQVVAGLRILPGNPGGLGIPDDYEQTLISFRDSFPSMGDYESFVIQLPEIFDWRDKGVVTRAKDQRYIVTPPDDQGRCGSCWAFGAVGAFESKIMMAGGAEYDLSEQQQISCNRNNQYGCCGGYVNAALFWRYRGPVRESCSGYGDYNTGDSCGCRFAPPYIHCAEVFCDTLESCDELPYRTDRYYSVDTTDINEIKLSLSEDGPSPLGFDTYTDFQNFWNTGSPGEVYRHSDGSRSGGHIVLLIGWDDGKQAWLCKNSWGERGPNNDGTVWIAYSGHITDLRFVMANFTIKNTASVTTTTTSTTTTSSTSSSTTSTSTTIVLTTTTSIAPTTTTSFVPTTTTTIPIPDGLMWNYGNWNEKNWN